MTSQGHHYAAAQA